MEMEKPLMSKSSLAVRTKQENSELRPSNSSISSSVSPSISKMSSKEESQSSLVSFSSIDLWAQKSFQLGQETTGSFLIDAKPSFSRLCCSSFERVLTVSILGPFFALIL